MLKDKWKTLFIKVEYLLSPIWLKLEASLSRALSTGKNEQNKVFRWNSGLSTAPTTTSIIIFIEKRLILREVI